MNRYGQRALELWTQLVPREVSSMSPEEKEQTFTKIGEEADRIEDQLYLEMEGPDLEGETYLQKVGRINAVRNQIEELIQNEVLMPPSWDPMTFQEEEEYQTEEEIRRAKFWREWQEGLDRMDETIRELHVIKMNER